MFTIFVLGVKSLNNLYFQNLFLVVETILYTPLFLFVYEKPLLRPGIPVEWFELGRYFIISSIILEVKYLHPKLFVASHLTCKKTYMPPTHPQINNGQDGI